VINAAILILLQSSITDSIQSDGNGSEKGNLDNSGLIHKVDNVNKIVKKSKTSSDQKVIGKILPGDMQDTVNISEVMSQQIKEIRKSCSQFVSIVLTVSKIIHSYFKLFKMFYIYSIMKTKNFKMNIAQQ
jgi:hypothetical protein